ncbi:MAG: NlpC/P60 family protein [Nitrospirales bacterium]|nr:C40 family peptidase [Nitrospira sp.]MDR4500611.1 NlpC/P60 family protein [Nitrospirales bacterium]
MRVCRINQIILAGVCCVLLSGCHGGWSQAKRPIASIHAMTVVSLSDEEAVKQSLYDQLKEWKAVDYDYGGLSKNGIDCSGFVYLTYRSHFGIELPRTSTDQANVGQPVVQRQLQAGDLVFFTINPHTRHVGIYVEGRKFLHASKSSGVRLSSLDNTYWAKKYWKAKRVEIQQPAV